jgi:heptosyltransferase I
MSDWARAADEPPQTICIVMLSAIGDAVHVLPVVNALKARWPAAEITWVIQPVPHKLVAEHRSVDHFLLFHRRKGASAWKSYRDLARNFPARPFDLVLSLQVYMKAGLIAGIAPGRRKLGFDRTRARDLNWLFTDERIPFRGQRHVQDQYFEFLEHLGIAPPSPVVWDIPIRPEERTAQRAFFERIERPACAVVVGTSKQEKNWNAEGYARVLEALDFEHGMRPVLVGGPSPVERAMAAEIRSLSRSRPLDALGDDLRRVLWILDGSALVISPDTGPLHIARALDVPVIGLYGYTNPKRTGPYRRFEDLVVDGYAEFPGEDYPITPHYRDGMKRVTVEAVLEKVALAREKYRR